MKKIYFIPLMLSGILGAAPIFAGSASHIFDLTLQSEAIYANNADLRELDTSSRSSVEYTDDRSFLVNSQLRLGVRSGILKHIRMHIEASVSGFWGNDSLSYRGKDNGITFTHLMLGIDLAGIFMEAPLSVWELSLGRMRQDMEPGTSLPSYIWKDVLDAVRLKWSHPSGWGAEWIMDMYSMNSPVYDMYAIDRDRHYQTVDFFNGDVNTYRWGFMPHYHIKDRGRLRLLSVKGFFLLADIGATGEEGGSEVSKGGMLFNRKDGDRLLLGGASCTADTGKWLFHLTAAASRGEDYNDDTVITARGYALYGGVRYAAPEDQPLRFYLHGMGSVISGAQADSEGTVTNYGFTGFKGETLGGIVFREYLGVFPGAILDYEGISFNTLENSRRAGILALHLNTGILSQRRLHAQWDLSLNQWWYWDNNHSDLRDDNTTELTRLEQLRWSKYMGYELGLRLHRSVHQKWRWGLEGGVFVPGEYFSLLLPNEASQGNDPAWISKLYMEISL